MDAPAPAEFPWPERRLPVPVALLLAVGVVVAVVRTSVSLSQNSPQSTVRLVIQAAEYASDFLVAAAIIGGTRRWLGGRVWLAAGGLLFVTHGALTLWSEVWGLQVDEIGQGLITLADYEARAWLFAVLIAAAGLLAPLLVAAALWFSRPGPAGIDGRRGLALLSVALLGCAAVAGHGVAIATYATTPGTVPPAMVAIVGWLDAAAAVALALLGVIALLAMPRGGATGNLLIALGVALALAADGWTFWFEYRVAPQNVAPALWELVYRVPAGIGVAGMLVMACGVVVGYRPWARSEVGSPP
jgi:hypothetical protein